VRKLAIFAVTMLILVTACSSTDQGLSQQLDAQSQRLTALEQQLNTLSTSTGTAGDQAEGLAAVKETVNGLRADLDALAVKVDAMTATEEGMDEHSAQTSADAFNVAVAQYFLDTAGFHGIDEALNETMTIEASYYSTVSRVRKVIMQITWPEELQEQATAFDDVLGQFAEALEADNAEEAAPLATQVHEAQHDLSHAIDAWLGEGGGEHDH
jgi:uncharacterized protein YoxC